MLDVIFDIVNIKKCLIVLGNLGRRYFNDIYIYLVKYYSDQIINVTSPYIDFPETNNIFVNYPYIHSNINIYIEPKLFTSEIYYDDKCVIFTSHLLFALPKESYLISYHLGDLYKEYDITNKLKSMQRNSEEGLQIYDKNDTLLTKIEDLDNEIEFDSSIIINLTYVDNVTLAFINLLRMFDHLRYYWYNVKRWKICCNKNHLDILSHILLKNKNKLKNTHFHMGNVLKYHYYLYPQL